MYSLAADATGCRDHLTDGRETIAVAALIQVHFMLKLSSGVRCCWNIDQKPYVLHMVHVLGTLPRPFC